MNNFVLCIDTSAGTTVAVLDGDQVASEFNFDENMMHAERIGDAINQALSAAKISPSQVASVVVGLGPAPYTGLRIGIAAAAMFAEAVGAKIYGVGSLDAIARLGLLASEGNNVPLLVTTDARRSENYWALYSGLTNSGAPILIEGPGVAKPAALEEKFAGQKIQRVSSLHNGDLANGDLVNSETPNAELAESSNAQIAKISAVELGRVFLAQLEDGTASHNVEAMYLRAPDAVAPKVLREFGKRVSG